MTMAQRIGRLLRRIADRIDYKNAPRMMGCRFKYEGGVRLVFGIDEGCPLMYRPSDYHLAFGE